jgi:hypothetical protein
MVFYTYLVIVPEHFGYLRTFLFQITMYCDTIFASCDRKIFDCIQHHLIVNFQCS